MCIFTNKVSVALEFKEKKKDNSYLQVHRTGIYAENDHFMQKTKNIINSHHLYFILTNVDIESTLRTILRQNYNCDLWYGMGKTHYYAIFSRRK